MNILKSFYKFAWTLGILLCLSRISIAGANESDNKAPAQKHGGELVVSLVQSPKHLNMAIQPGLAIGVPCVQIFASPLRFDANRNPQPYLAEKWEMANDNLSLTLYLVKGATFHDGKPITSKDVAFSIMTIKKYHSFQSMFASVERVETPDPFIAILRLSKPNPVLLIALSPPLCPILPSHIFGDGQDIKTHPANMKPIGSGPFKLKEFIPETQIVLERYDHFFIKEHPYLDKITMLANLNFDEVQIGLETEKIDLLDALLDVDNQMQLAQNSNLQINRNGFEAFGPLTMVEFNLRKKPFSDLKVRQALAYATDREFISKILLKEKSKFATGPITPNSPFYTKDVDLYKYNIEKANQLLDEAGYPRNHMGKRFSFTFDYQTASISDLHMVTDYLRQEWLRNLGVDAQIRYSKTFAEWMDRVSNWNFEATIDVIWNWGDPMIGVHRTYLSSNIRKGVIWSNMAGYQSQEADALMEQASTTLNFATRKELYVKLQQILVHDIPVIWLYQSPFATIHNRDLMNVNQSLWGILSPFDEIYWKNK